MKMCIWKVMFFSLFNNLVNIGRAYKICSDNQLNNKIDFIKKVPLDHSFKDS